MITKFTILGERCSGTNWLENLVKLNFGLEPTWEYGHKHFFGFNDFENSDDCLFIGIVRDPHTWANSLYKVPYHLHDGLKWDVKKFLNNEWWSHNEGIPGENKCDRNMFTGERYKNFFEMRHNKLKYLIEEMPKKVKNYILFKYEDLRDNFEETMSRFTLQFEDLSPIEDFPVNITTRHGRKGHPEFKINTNFVMNREDVIDHPDFNDEYEEQLGYV